MTDHDILAPALVVDPYPYFHELLEHEPVHWNERYKAWVVTRFDDVSALFRDPRISSDRISSFLARLDAEEAEQLDPVFSVLAKWMVFQDPPSHTRLRKLVARAFTVRSVERLRDDVQEVIDELIQEIGTPSHFDLIEAFAFPLPAIVIAKMLGVPPEDRDLFKGWSDDLISLLFGAVEVADRRERAQVGMLELTAYLRRLIEQARTTPDDNLISSLVRAEEAGDALTLDEVVATCVLLLFGGHETTTNLIGNGMLALLQHPGELAALQSDLGLLPAAVEEVLRFDGPAKVSVRSVREDLEVRGRTLRAGDRLFLVPAAANRDPRRFPDPDRFDIRRSDKGHMGFGFGIHYCLGAPLARLEGELALGAIVEHFPSAQLTTEELAWHPTLLSRGVTSLPLTLASG